MAKRTAKQAAQRKYEKAFSDFKKNPANNDALLKVCELLPSAPAKKEKEHKL